MTNDISGVVKNSAYNYSIFIRQKIKNETARGFYSSSRSGAAQYYVVVADVFACFGLFFAP